MTNIAVYDDSITPAIGLPNIFLEDRNFSNVLTNPGMRAAIVQQFGSGICIGRLGKLVNGVYEEQDNSQLPKEIEEKGDMGFFEDIL